MFTGLFHVFPRQIPVFTAIYLFYFKTALSHDLPDFIGISTETTDFHDNCE